MFEQLLSGTKQLPPDTGDVIFYIDMATVKETINNRPITISNGAVVSTAQLIDGKPTLYMPTAGGSGSRLLMNLNPALDLSLTNWTVEWSEYRTANATTWTNEVYLSDSTLYKGFTMRFGDTGYDNLLMFSDNNNTNGRSECRINVTRTEHTGMVVRYAVTCDEARRLRFYINGNLVQIRNGNNSSSSAPLQDYFQSGPAGNFAALTTLYMGALNNNANNVARYLGNVRISNYVRYRGNYTPVPI